MREQSFKRKPLPSGCGSSLEYDDLNYDLYNNFFKSLIIESNLFNNSTQPNEIMIECTNIDDIYKLRKEIIQTTFNISVVLKEDYLILNRMLKFIYLLKEYGSLDTIYELEIKNKFNSILNFINYNFVNFDNDSLENNLKNINKFKNIEKLKNINLNIFDNYENLFKNLEFKLTNLTTKETFLKTITINSLIQNENDLDDYLNLFEKNYNIDLNLS